MPKFIRWIRYKEWISLHRCLWYIQIVGEWMLFWIVTWTRPKENIDWQVETGISRLFQHIWRLFVHCGWKCEKYFGIRNCNLDWLSALSGLFHGWIILMIGKIPWKKLDASSEHIRQFFMFAMFPYVRKLQSMTHLGMVAEKIHVNWKPHGQRIDWYCCHRNRAQIIPNHVCIHLVLPYFSCTTNGQFQMLL